jgi:protein-tyrosine phosphatase
MRNSPTAPHSNGSPTAFARPRAFIGGLSKFTNIEDQGGTDIIYISYPIPDRGVLSTISDAKSIIDALARYITEGKHVAVHCRMGIGRSTMMAAATLVALGETPERAFAMIQEARGCEVPDTPEQLQWVKRFSAGIQTSDQK